MKKLYTHETVAMGFSITMIDVSWDWDRINMRGHRKGKPEYDPFTDIVVEDTSVGVRIGGFFARGVWTW